MRTENHLTGTVVLLSFTLLWMGIAGLAQESHIGKLVGQCQPWQGALPALLHLLPR